MTVTAEPVDRLAAAPHVVLVHGMGGTPATWAEVVPRLVARGHAVTAVTNPMVSLAGDAAHTAGVVRAIEGPVLLVGHSYGGAVITAVGVEPTVVGLVYVAAFAPAEGESINQIVERYDPAPASGHMQRGADGSWQSTRTPAYWAEIAWDVPEVHRQAEGYRNRPAADAIFQERMGPPAWAFRPSWYLLAEQDASLVPATQRDMATRAGADLRTVAGSHFTPLARPDVVVELIEEAAGTWSPGVPC